jgi:hypothetical protein
MVDRTLAYAESAMAYTLTLPRFLALLRAKAVVDDSFTANKVRRTHFEYAHTPQVKADKWGSLRIGLQCVPHGYTRRRCRG